MSPKYYHPQLNDVEDQILKTTMNVVNDAQFIINKVKERSTTMSVENKQAAAQYINGIRDVLKERTNLGVQQMNQIISDKISEVESELISFNNVITEATNGIVDYTKDDLNLIKENVIKIESGDAASSLDQALHEVEVEIKRTFDDIDQMYSFYERYLGEIIVHKIQNATDRISMMLNSQRKYCDCTLMDRINICYNITAQNGEISKDLESMVKVIGILTNTSDTIDNLQSVFADADPHSRQFYEDSKVTLNQVLQKSQETLDSLLKNDDCFLGSVIRTKAFLAQPHVKRYILRSYQTSIESLAKNLNTTTVDFQIVTVHQKNLLKENLDQILEDLGEEIKKKASLIRTTIKDDYMSKANFNELKAWMQDKMTNATEVINPLFEKNQEFVAESLKYTLQYIVNQQLPFISSLSVKNYLPSDVCPLSTDYQKFISITLNEYMRRDESNMIEDMFASADFFSDDTEVLAPIASEIIEPTTSAALMSTGMTGEYFTLPDANLQYSENEENFSTPLTSLMDLIQKIVDNITEAGFTLAEPVEVYISTDKK
ncbi:hypothetical protein PGB90_006692 [Kerria lacca]